VLPADLIAWYRTPEGQWFHDTVSSSLLPKPIVETRDAEAQWQWVRAFYEKNLTPLVNVTNYMAEHLLFGTDTPLDRSALAANRSVGPGPD
jgi:hypothetical protein